MSRALHCWPRPAAIPAPRWPRPNEAAPQLSVRHRSKPMMNRLFLIALSALLLVGCRSTPPKPQDLSVIRYEITINPPTLGVGSINQVVHRWTNTGTAELSVCLLGDGAVLLNGNAVQASISNHFWCQIHLDLEPGESEEWMEERVWNWECRSPRSDHPALASLPSCDSDVEISFQKDVCGIPGGQDLPCQQRRTATSNARTVRILGQDAD